jgi:protein SCO1/2
MTPFNRLNRRLALTALLGAGLAACSAEKPAFSGIDITGAEYARRLALPDAGGKPRTLADFKGKVVVVFFGYTQCPDVCPTTLAEIAEVKQKLGADGDKLQTVFVTIDPERDTPEMLAAYVGSFGRDFVALRGTLEQTKEAAKEFKVFFAKVPGKGEGSYSMDHTAGSYVFDTQGRVRLFVRQGGGAEAMVHDVKLLLGGA